MKKLVIFTTGALVRFSFTGDIKKINQELKNLGYRTLPENFNVKSIGKPLGKIFSSFCSAIGADNDKKRTKVKKIFNQNIKAEKDAEINCLLANLKKSEIKIALINQEFLLEEKLEKVGINKNDFHLIDQPDAEKGTAAVLKNCLSWADQLGIERDKIIFVGTKAHEYITALEAKPEIDFLGISTRLKDDHFKDMGLSKNRLGYFGEISDKLKNILSNRA